MKLFLDDTRNAPKDFILVKSYEELINILKETNAKEILEISLDHDLGTIKTGYDVCKWMVENDYWIEKISLHSANIVGVMNMFQLLNRYAPAFVSIERVIR